MLKAVSYLSTVIFFVLVASPVPAAIYCVGTAAQLADAVAAAAANDASDTICVRQGTYSGNFVFDSSEDWDVEIVGGYNADCSLRAVDAATTILDGGGSGTTLLVRINGDGNVQVDGLTIRHGASGGLYFNRFNGHSDDTGSLAVRNCMITGNAGSGGVYILASDTPAYVPGSIRLEGNVISGNVSTSSHAALSIFALWDAQLGDVILTNNMVVGNRGEFLNGGVYIGTGSATQLFLVNNTIADNRATTTLINAGGVRIDNAPLTYMNFSNNIIRGNASLYGVADLWFNDGTSCIGHNNNYTDLDGTWSDAADNLDVDPSFRLPGHWNDNGTPGIWSDDTWVDGDYHLSAGSACIDAGDGASPELPLLDIEGDSREIDGDGDGVAVPDIGADEFSGGCMADTDLDGDVDGSDLAAVAVGTVSLDPGIIAEEFGKMNCL
jgi:hypothetical protein